MDKKNTIAIIEALADGIDPATGEVFPPDSPYQNADVIRALFHALDVLKKAEKPKPDRQGEPWTEKEDQQLKQEFLNEKKVAELAKIHQRSQGAIRSRLVKIGLIKP